MHAADALCVFRTCWARTFRASTIFFRVLNFSSWQKRIRDEQRGEGENDALPLSEMFGRRAQG